MRKSPSDQCLLTPAPVIEPQPESRDGLTDEKLLHRYRRSRSPEDLGEIARRHRPMVLRTCLRLAGNAHDAEDAAQSVFLALAQRPEMIRRSLVGGLHELGRAAVSELFRSRRRRLRREEEATRRGPFPVQSEKATGPTDRNELQEELDVALEQLSDALKQAVILRYLEGHSQQEAARLAGCTTVAMGWRSMKGLQKLRNILGPRGVEAAGGVIVALLVTQAKSSAASVVIASTASPLSLNSLVRRLFLLSLLRQAGVGIAVVASVVVIGIKVWPSPAPEPVVPASALGGFEQSMDLGGPAIAGKVEFADGRYTVQAGGARIYLDADQFRFVHRSWEGDGEIVAQVASDPNQDGRQVAAGVMFRERLESNSLHVAMLVTSNETRATFRTPASQPSSNVHIARLAKQGTQWVKMVRRGDHFTMFVRSESAPDWTLVKELDVVMSRSLHIGLAVTANDDTKLATATFENVSCVVP